MRLVLGDRLAARRLLLEQVKEDIGMKAGEASSEREVMAALLKALPHWRKRDARLLPLATELVKGSGGLMDVDWDGLVAVGQELQRLWNKSGNKDICSRRLGFTRQCMPVLAFLQGRGSRDRTWNAERLWG